MHNKTVAGKLKIPLRSAEAIKPKPSAKQCMDIAQLAAQYGWKPPAPPGKKPTAKRAK